MSDPIEDLAWEVISAIIPAPLVRSSQRDAERPPKPYATYRIISRKTIGTDEQVSTDENGVMTLRGLREGVIQISVFGGNARFVCDTLLNNARKESSRYLMRRVRFWLNANAGVKDTSAARDKLNFEQMATVDLYYRHQTTYQDDVGIIDTADVTGDLDGKTLHIIVPLE